MEFSKTHGFLASALFVGMTRAGQTMTHTIELDNVTGFERFFFPASFRNLASVTWQQGDNVTSGPHIFDNVVVVPSKFKPRNGLHVRDQS